MSNQHHTTQNSGVHFDINNPGDAHIGSIKTGDNINAAEGSTVVRIDGSVYIYNEAQKRIIPMQLDTRPENYIGRDELIDQLTTDMRPGHTIAICATGGMGKTAVVVETLYRMRQTSALLDRFPDGVLFHSFYVQPRTTQIFEHIARTFRIDTRQDLTSAMRQALSGRAPLIILDGCERAENLPEVTHLLGECGVIITSRSTADAGESDPIELDTLPPDDALQLVQRWAGRMAADTTVTAEICQRVGYLPLALRLAGKFMRSSKQPAPFYLAWVRENLFHSLEQDKREKDIERVIAHSIAQLTAEGQDVIEIAGALALAPFSHELVRAVMGTENRRWQQGLANAVECGLLIVPDIGVGDENEYEYEDTGRMWYMTSHALIHHFAQQLVALDTELHHQLVDLFVQQLKDADKNYQHKTLTSEKEHVFHLAETCLNLESWADVSRLAFACNDWFSLQGDYRYWVTLLNYGTQATQQSANRRDEGAHLGNLGLAYSNLGQVEEAIQYHEQALLISREIGDRRGEGANLGNLGLAYSNLGQVEEAIQYYEQALLISREIGDRRGEGNRLGNLGLAYANLGQVQEAIQHHEQALLISREIGDRRSEGSHLGNLGLAYSDLGQVQEAIQYHEQALLIREEIGDRRGEGADLGNLGSAYRNLGQVQEAIQYHEQALLISREIGDRRGEGNRLGNLGNAYQDLGQVQEAIQYHEQALLISREIGDRRSEGISLGNLGNAYSDLEQVQKAIQYHEQALLIREKIGDKMGIAIDHFNLGLVYKDLAEFDKARPLWEKAHQLFTEIGSPHAQAVQNALDKLSNPPQKKKTFWQRLFSR